jgi:SAM-dependent methyltransferase
MRVNLGCGLNAPDGWVNIDRSPSIALTRLHIKPVLRRLGFAGPHLAEWPSNIRRHDMTKGLPFADGSVQAIYSSHALEHVYLNEAQAVLRECFRVLRPDAIVRLALPDSEAMVRALLDGGGGLRFNEDLAMHPLARPRLRAQLLRAVGAGIHRWQPTRDLVVDLLSQAGFEQIKEHGFCEGSLPDIQAVEHRDGSLFIEAVKPPR